MLNIKDRIYKALSDELGNVSDSYPSDWENLPAIQYTEEDNRVHEWGDDQELSSYVRYRIDIWCNSSTSVYAIKVDEIMSKFGLKRTSCGDDNSDRWKHKIMRYEAIYDINNDFIYHNQ